MADAPPQNLEAEESVLGAMMVSDGAISKVLVDVHLQRDEFYRQRHRTIFGAIHSIHSRGEPVDALTVTEQLTSLGELTEAGGKEFVSGLASTVPVAGNAEHYGRIVKAKAEWRRRLEAAQTIATASRSENEELFAKGQQLLATPHPTTGSGRLVDGASFVLDAPRAVPAIWGDSASGEVLWAQGEPTLLVGPEGVGKGTIAQQLADRRAGVIPGPLFNMPVTPGGKVLYVAADRPSQIQRSWARMGTEAEREKRGAALSVWRGPLPFDLGRSPGDFVPFIESTGADTVILDSVGALAADLSKEEGGAGVGRSFLMAAAAGIELLAVFHPRKREMGAKQHLRSIDDIYGSRWITSWCGSVLALNGDPGDLIVELRHLKPPADLVGPLKVRHDHHAGRSFLQDEVNLAEAATDGLTVRDAASLLFGTKDPERKHIQKARRELAKLVPSELRVRRAGDKTSPTVWERS